MLLPLVVHFVHPLVVHFTRVRSWECGTWCTLSRSTSPGWDRTNCLWSDPGRCVRPRHVEVLFGPSSVGRLKTRFAHPTICAPGFPIWHLLQFCLLPAFCDDYVREQDKKKVGLGRSERSWLDLSQCVISNDKVHMGFALSRTPAYSKMSVTLVTYGMFLLWITKTQDRCRRHSGKTEGIGEKRTVKIQNCPALQTEKTWRKTLYSPQAAGSGQEERS